MRWLWNWEGKCFGYQEEDNLRTVEGRHVGVFFGDEIYGEDGSYLGEVRNGRLITDLSKKWKTRSGFSPLADTKRPASVVDGPSYIMYAGHEDFPSL